MYIYHTIINLKCCRNALAYTSFFFRCKKRYLFGRAREHMIYILK